MKAIVVHQYGGPEVLNWEDYPDPIPGPGEVLIRVAAASVNPSNAADFPSVKAVFVLSKFDRKTLEFMSEAVRDDKLVIPVSRKLPLSEAAKAQPIAEKGGAGKILLVS
jgi:NADPH:quinone reductase-like Zn-dependent oxidoreductase